MSTVIQVNMRKCVIIFLYDALVVAASYQC